MHIYIDEAGIFNNPDNRSNVPSCLGTLVIPSSQKKKIFSDFEWIKSKWGAKGKEKKGSELDEAQVASVVSMLKKYDVLLEMTAIDMELHTEQEITDFKKKQIENITINLTPKHQPHVIKQANELKASFERMSNPLFVQALIMFYLIPRTLNHALLYYARRIPEELGRFYWEIDAKQEKVTDFEKAWSTLIYVTMSTQSFNEPVSFVEGGDYSHFDKFHRDDPIDEDLVKEYGLDPNDLKDINLSKVLSEHRNFRNSKDSIGLQIADILVTATRRALKGTLQQSGWGEIGSFMINKRLDGSWNGIQSIRLNLSDAAENKTVPIKNSLPVFQTYLSKAKSILRPDELTRR